MEFKLPKIVSEEESQILLKAVEDREVKTPFLKWINTKQYDLMVWKQVFIGLLVHNSQRYLSSNQGVF